MQPILSVTLTVKKIKGAANQRYSDSDGIVRCEQTLTGADGAFCLFVIAFFLSLKSRTTIEITGRERLIRTRLIRSST